MLLALIGGRSVNAVQDVIKKNFDNLEIHTYKSIGDFTNEMSVRNLDVDRMVIMQDGIIDEPNLDDLLKDFFEYLAKFYPAMRIVSLAKDVNLTHKLASIFVSPLCAHIVSNTVKPRLLLDMVSKDIQTVQAEYGYKEIKVGKADEVEIIGEDDTPEEVNNTSEGTPDGQQAGAPAPNAQTQQKKKKGLFGLFGKKNKKKESKQREVIGQVRLDKEVESKPEMVMPPEGSLGDGVDEDDYLQQLENLPQDTEQPVEEEKKEDDDVDFSVFQVPVGPTAEELPKEEDILPPALDEINFNSSKNKSEYNQVDSNSLSEKIKEYEAKAEKTARPIVIGGLEKDVKPENKAEENQTNFEDKKEEVKDDFSELDSYFDDIPEEDFDDIAEEDFDNSGFEPTLDIEDIPVTNDEPVVDININLEDKKKKIEDLKGTLTQEVDTDLSDIDAPIRKRNINLNLESVSDTGLNVDDLDSLQSEYQEKTAPVVEKVVERVVQINTGGLNKNGVRFIILTGDRRNGITRNALELAAQFAKNKSTLYVDFDIERRGSLAYLDIEDILSCQDIVQNGLGTLSKVNTLDKLTYRDMKHGFDCLISLYDNELTNEDIKRVSKLLIAQRVYSTVIIDCPLDKLHTISSILAFATIMICVENNYISLLNTITSIMNSTDLSEDDMLCLYNNSKYLITRNYKNPQAFTESMDYLDVLFDFEHSEFDWTAVEVAATSGNLNTYAANN